MARGVRPSIQRWVLLTIAIAVFLFATFPGKGGLEGDQRDVIGFSNRTDNWGFIVPFLIGEWPNIFGHWRFSLVLFQLMIFWIGLWLLFRRIRPTKGIPTILFSIFVLFCSVFASQLWRDSTLLSLATFGFGLAAISFEMKGARRIALFALSIVVLHLAALFKVLYGVIIGILFIWLTLQNRKSRKSTALISLLIAGSLSISPFIADKYLVRESGMKKVFPEQQPMIFDLASSYCWGTSDQLISDASRGLTLVLRKEFPLQSVCSSLRPTSWDNLHANPNVWEFSSPIERIVGSQDQKVHQLRERWISMIIRNPIDWLQVRLMYLGWTVTLSNSLVPQNESNTFGGMVGKINKTIWQIFFITASLIDKSRISSILFALAFLSSLLVYQAFLSKGNRYFFWQESKELFMGFFVLLATISVTLIGFVASNGRYVLPYVILSYIFLIRSRIPFFLIRSRSFRSPIQE